MRPAHPAIPPSGDPEVAGYLPGPSGILDGGQGASSDMEEYARILLKRRYTVLLTCMLVMVAAVAYLFTAPRLYRAEAKVQILQSRPVLRPAAARAGGPTDLETGLKTQAEIIASSLVAQRTAERLRAEQGVTVSVDEIRRGLKVGRTEKDGGHTASEVLSISMESKDPQRAALVANAVTDTYIEEDIAAARAEVGALRKFLEAQLTRVKQDVLDAEAGVTRYRAEHLIQGDLGPAEALRARAVDEYIAAAERAETELAGGRADLEALRIRLGTHRPTRRAPRVVADPEMAAFQEDIARAEVELAKARGLYDDSHPRVVTLRERLEEMHALMRERFGDRRAPYRLVEVEEPDPEYEVIRERVKDQEGRVQSLAKRAELLLRNAAAKRASLPDAAKALVELQRLERSKEVAENTYLSMLERFQQARIDEAAKLGIARKVDVARVPTIPVRPKNAQTLLLAGALGIFIGALLGLIQERADTSIYDPDEMVRRTGIPVLGAVPAAPSRRGSPLSPQRSVTEALRLVHASLKFTSADQPTRTLAVTSVAPGEGKTFIALHLANVIAQTSLRVILVEADMRRPSLPRLLRWKHSPGLTEVVSGEVALKDALRDTEAKNLRVLCAGRPTSNPTALLDSQPMAELIQQLQQEADLVIFDTPPALTMADTVLLAARVDAMIVVVQQGGVPAKAIVEVGRMIEQAQGRIAGAVMNKMRPGMGGPYAYYHRYADYSNGKERRDTKRLPALPGKAPDWPAVGS